MRQSKFTEEQIAFALHQADTGISVEEVCRKGWRLAGHLLRVEEEVRRRRGQ